MNAHIQPTVDTDWQTVKVPRPVFCRISTKADRVAALLEILYGDIEDVFDKTKQSGHLAELVMPQAYFDRTVTVLALIAEMSEEVKDALIGVELGEEAQ